MTKHVVQIKPGVLQTVDPGGPVQVFNCWTQTRTHALERRVMLQVGGVEQDPEEDQAEGGSVALTPVEALWVVKQLADWLSKNGHPTDVLYVEKDN